MHAWDKFLSFKKGDGKREILYAHAVEGLRGMFVGE